MKQCSKITMALAATAMVAIATSCEDDKPASPKPSPRAPATASAEADDHELADDEITAAVKLELAHDEMVPSGAISVKTLRGIVSLTGPAPHLLAKERAARIASAVKGVRSVSNRIVVQPAKRDDQQIRDDVEHQLLTDPVTESYEITPQVDDGVVTLKGTVDSWPEKRLAGSVAKRVTGVKQVVNGLAVHAKADRPAAEIKAEVERRLEWDVLVDDGLIDVTVRGGEVHLDGTVGSAAERRQAASDAYVAGVRTVDATDLDVKWWAEDKNLRKARAVSGKSDEAIEQAVSDALLYDPRVDAGDVEVESRGGHVTLDGQVASQRSKLVAERLADNTVGVRAVVNSLVIDKPATPMEEAKLARQIRKSLRINPVTESYEIDVSVRDGDVVLAGKVDSYFERAEAVSEALRQVDDETIVDQLKVDKPTTSLVVDRRLYPDFPDVLDWKPYARTAPLIEDAKLDKAIRHELFWDPDVDSWQVKVKVDGADVTLSGKVDTWYERWAAERNALQAGALTVDNELQIK